MGRKDGDVNHFSDLGFGKLQVREQSRERAEVNLMMYDNIVPVLVHYFYSFEIAWDLEFLRDRLRIIA